MSSWPDRPDGPLRQFRDWLVASPTWFQVLGGVAILAIVSGVVHGLVVGDDTGRPDVAVNTGSTAEPPRSLPTTTLVSTTTVPPTTVTSTTVVAPTTTSPIRTTTAPRPATTTTRRPAATTPPTTRARFGTFCGYVPGATIEIDINGQSSGSQVANADGCITVNP